MIRLLMLNIKTAAHIRKTQHADLYTTTKACVKATWCNRTVSLADFAIKPLNISETSNPHKTIHDRTTRANSNAPLQMSSNVIPEDSVENIKQHIRKRDQLKQSFFQRTFHLFNKLMHTRENALVQSIANYLTKQTIEQLIQEMPPHQQESHSLGEHIKSAMRSKNEVDSLVTTLMNASEDSSIFDEYRRYRHQCIILIQKNIEKMPLDHPYFKAIA